MASRRFINLNNGAKMPLLGFGTWQAKDAEVEKAVDVALKTGYRHIDTASLYDNEHVIGKVLSSWISQGKLKREDLFITTKLPHVGLRPESVEKWLKRSLEKLHTDYVDLYLIHGPYGFQEQGDALFPVGPDGAYLVDHSTDHLSIWKTLEAQVDAGRAKAIGLSTFNMKQIQRILDNSRIKPANLQVELHLHLQQEELVKFCKQNGISVTAYSSLGTPGSTALFGSSLPDLLADPTVKTIAEKYKKTPAQILLRHILQKDIIIIPKSTNPQRIAQNFQLFDFELSSDDMARLNAADRGEDGRIFSSKLTPDILRNHPEFPFPIKD